MAESTTAPAVYRAIAGVIDDLARIGIGKTRRNQQQNYAFRGIDDVLNTLSPLLAKHGLVVVPRVTERTVTERHTTKGGVLFCVVIAAEFDFIAAEDGSIHTARMYGEAMDSADKATNKAMSAAYKYAAFQVFCIPTDVEDADAVTHDVAPHAAQPTAPSVPDGYTDWIDCMTDTAQEGTTALTRAWSDSPIEYRRYIRDHEEGRWTAIRKLAEARDTSHPEAAA
ncbi:MAG TPA: ERF family protein [Vicinamibacterales bacterium]|nr:ERF family protein [Vicinamibacterales bacterium]